MANVWHWYGSWVSADEVGLLPGDHHDWIAWPVNFTDTVSITATPIAGDAEHILEVSNVRMEADSSGNRHILFRVTNVGSSPIIAYANGYGYITE